MGQPIVVVEKPSIANPGMVRFETNRAITGMGHERYVAGTEVRGDRPPDELARRLLAHGGIEVVHINGSVVTVDLAKGYASTGLKEIIEGLYIHYPPTAEDAEAAVADADAPESEGEAVEQVAAAPAEVAPDPKHTEVTAADEAVADAPGPDEEGAPAPSSTSSASVTADADEETEADVQQAEGDAPTLDQAPPGGTPSDPPADDPTTVPAEDAPSAADTEGDAPGADTIDPDAAAAAAAVDEARSSEAAAEGDDPEAAATTASGTDADADSDRPAAGAAERAPLEPGESPTAE